MHADRKVEELILASNEGMNISGTDSDNVDDTSITENTFCESDSDDTSRNEPKNSTLRTLQLSANEPNEPHFTQVEDGLNKNAKRKLAFRKLSSQTTFLIRVLAQLRHEHQVHYDICPLLSTHAESRAPSTAALQHNDSSSLLSHKHNKTDANSAGNGHAKDQMQMELLKSQLEILREENIHLQMKIQRLEELKVVFQPITTRILEQAKDQAPDPHTKESESEVELEGHNECHRKCQELWQTIKSLQLYVETYRGERDEMMRQRDEAIASAETAWAANIRLAGNGNPHQKIKYLQSLKEENTKLREKTRKLELRLSAKELNARHPQSPIRENNGKPTLPSASDTLSQHSSQESCMGKLEVERNELFRKMWSRNKKLQSEIDRLRAQRKSLQNGKAQL